jgi:hypothetical protein
VSPTLVLRKAAVGFLFVLLGMACLVWAFVMPFLGLFYTIQLLT